MWGGRARGLAVAATRSFALRPIHPDPTLSSSAARLHSSPAPAEDDAAAALLGVRAPASPSAVADKARALASAAGHYGRCYWELSKARLSMLVVATSGTGYILGSGSVVDIAGLVYTCAGTMMVAASANSLNQVFEKHNDALMKRTRQRPLPSGRIAIPHATTWASTIGIAGTTLLSWKTNSLAAGLAASNLALYAFLYTPLKQIHPINTWVGAIVGAIPPLLGWAAASGEVSLNGMLLPAALYFWQIPHFMALAYLCRHDYAAGGFRMFTLNDPSGQRTALVSLRNCLYLLPLGYFAYDWGIASKWVFLESSVLTLGITAAAFAFAHERTTKNARRMFHASLLYLPVFMTGLLLHRLPNEQKESAVISKKQFHIHEEHDWEAKDTVQSNVSDQYDKKNLERSLRGDRVGLWARPPVAYASVAPFPFLPVPLYVPVDP